MNKMVLSPEKSVYLNFALRGDPVVFNNLFYVCVECLCSERVCVNKCVKIGGCESVKYLGVIIDKELNWKNHINSLKSKLNSLLRLFYFMRDLCPIDVLRTVYFSLVHSRIEYGIVCWGGGGLITVMFVH